MEDGEEYKLFRVLEKEISLDVDRNDLLYRTNLDIHFSDMEKTGNMSPTNTAGAAYELVTVMGSEPATPSGGTVRATARAGSQTRLTPYYNSRSGDGGACYAVIDLWEANDECGSRDGDRFIAPTVWDG